MLNSLIRHPNTTGQVQFFYFFHRTKEAFIQQAILASVFLVGSESILRGFGRLLSKNRDIVIGFAQDTMVAQLKAATSTSSSTYWSSATNKSNEKTHVLIAEAILKHKDELPDFFGPKVLREILILYGLKKADDPTLTLKGTNRSISKMIMKDYMMNRMMSFAMIALIDVATRPVLESWMSVNTIRSMSYFASAKADGISGVYSLTSPICLNNVIEFQSQVGNYLFGRLYRIVERLFCWNPFVAPAWSTPPTFSTEGNEEREDIISDTLYSHMNNLVDTCVFYFGLEVTMQLRLAPLNFYKSKTVAIDTLKKTIPRSIGRWVAFLGVTIGLNEALGWRFYPASVCGFVVGQIMFPWVKM